MSTLVILTGLVVFSLVHSWLAGSSIKAFFRARLGERAFEGWYRFGYNVFATLTFAPLPVLLALFPGAVIWRSDNTLFTTVLLLIQLAGAAGLIISLLQIDLGQFSGLAQALAYLEGKALPLPAEPLQTGGVYALVRHPLYLFSLMAIWPLPIMTEGLLVFNLGITAYFVVGSLLEERRMIQVFGDEYRAYQRRVSWLIPLPRQR